MSIDVEYAIKQDVRNNPIVREVDAQQRQDFIRLVWRGALIVLMVLVWAWQHSELAHRRFELSDLRKAEAQEDVLNRKLRLQMERMRSPQEIARRAGQELHMIAPDQAVVVEIETAPPAAHAVVASNR